MSPGEDRFGTVFTAVLLGMVVVFAGTIPRNFFFAANLQYFTSVPWAVPVTGAYIWFFWRYLRGDGPPASTAGIRRRSLRANRIQGRVWVWALVAGGLGVVALVLALRVANRLIELPEQEVPDLSHVPRLTVLSLLLMSAPVAGIIEEAAFRGYMQGPLERTLGMTFAILITGTMFALAHLDFTLILWPYYVAVAAIYGTVTWLTNSILPAVVLHTAGNIYSNLDLWLHGQAEWQAPSGARLLVWQTGIDTSFGLGIAALAVVSLAMVWSYVRLAKVGVRRGSDPGDGETPGVRPTSDPQREALQILDEVLSEFRQESYEQLVSRIGLSSSPVVLERPGADGSYQLEISFMWDGAAGGDVRVIGSIDDGGWRAFVPLTRSFIKAADGSFVGE